MSCPYCCYPCCTPYYPPCCAFCYVPYFVCCPPCPPTRTLSPHKTEKLVDFSSTGPPDSPRTNNEPPKKKKPPKRKVPPKKKDPPKKDPPKDKPPCKIKVTDPHINLRKKEEKKPPRTQKPTGNKIPTAKKEKPKANTVKDDRDNGGDKKNKTTPEKKPDSGDPPATVFEGGINHDGDDGGKKKPTTTGDTTNNTDTKPGVVVVQKPKQDAGEKKQDTPDKQQERVDNGGAGDSTPTRKSICKCIVPPVCTPKSRYPHTTPSCPNKTKNVYTFPFPGESSYTCKITPKYTPRPQGVPMPPISQNKVPSVWNKPQQPGTQVCPTLPSGITAWNKPQQPGGQVCSGRGTLPGGITAPFFPNKTKGYTFPVPGESPCTCKITPKYAPRPQPVPMFPTAQNKERMFRPDVWNEPQQPGGQVCSGRGGITAWNLPSSLPNRTKQPTASNVYTFPFPGESLRTCKISPKSTPRPQGVPIPPTLQNNEKMYGLDARNKQQEPRGQVCHGRDTLPCGITTRNLPSSLPNRTKQPTASNVYTFPFPGETPRTFKITPRPQGVPMFPTSQNKEKMYSPSVRNKPQQLGGQVCSGRDVLPCGITAWNKPQQSGGQMYSGTGYKPPFAGGLLGGVTRLDRQPNVPKLPMAPFQNKRSTLGASPCTKTPVGHTRAICGTCGSSKFQPMQSKKDCYFKGSFAIT